MLQSIVVRVCALDFIKYRSYPNLTLVLQDLRAQSVSMVFTPNAPVYFDLS